MTVEPSNDRLNEYTLIPTGANSERQTLSSAVAPALGRRRINRGKRGNMAALHGGGDFPAYLRKVGRVRTQRAEAA
jgi:hypothetical protein